MHFVLVYEKMGLPCLPCLPCECKEVEVVLAKMGFESSTPSPKIMNDSIMLDELVPQLCIFVIGTCWTLILANEIRLRIQDDHVQHQIKELVHEIGAKLADVRHALWRMFPRVELVVRLVKRGFCIEYQLVNLGAWDFRVEGIEMRVNIPGTTFPQKFDIINNEGLGAREPFAAFYKAFYRTFKMSEDDDSSKPPEGKGYTLNMPEDMFNGAILGAVRFLKPLEPGVPTTLIAYNTVQTPKCTPLLKEALEAFADKVTVIVQYRDADWNLRALVLKRADD